MTLGVLITLDDLPFGDLGEGLAVAASDYARNDRSGNLGADSHAALK